MWFDLRIFFFALTVSVFLFAGCVTPAPPDCVTQGSETATIRWGSYLPATEERTGYELRGNAELYAYSVRNGQESFSKIDRVSNEEYCGLLATTKENFLKIQSLNAPGDSSRFVEYSNPKSSTHLRAIWNAKYETYGSREFRELYKSLSTLVVHYE